MQLDLYVPDEQNEGFLHAQTIADRLRKQFPSTLVDWDKGDARVQRQLDDLIANNCPELILQSQQTCFGHMALELAIEKGTGLAAEKRVLAIEKGTA